MPGSQGAADPAVRRSAGVHLGGAIQLRLEGLLRPAQRPGAGQQPVLADPFGFERPFIRGLKKMRLRCTMALTIMLAMALGRIRGRPAGAPA